MPTTLSPEDLARRREEEIAANRAWAARTGNPYYEPGSINNNMPGTYQYGNLSTFVTPLVQESQSGQTTSRVPSPTGIAEVGSVGQQLAFQGPQREYLNAPPSAPGTPGYAAPGGPGGTAPGGPSFTTPDVSALGKDAADYMASYFENYPGMEGIQSDLAGILSPDVRRQIYQSAAERGVAIGAPGSENADAAMLRAIGLTSQQLRQQGQQNLLGAIQSAPQLDINNLFISPTEQSRQGLSWNIANLEQSGALQRLREGNANQIDLANLNNVAEMARAQLGESGALQRLREGNANQVDLTNLNNAAQMARLQLESSGAMERLQAGLANQTDLTNLNNAAQMARLQLESSGAMDRLREGNANQLDITNLNNASALARITLESMGALDRLEVGLTNQTDLAVLNNASALARLTLENSGAMDRARLGTASASELARISSQSAMERAILDAQTQLQLGAMRAASGGGGVGGGGTSSGGRVSSTTGPAGPSAAATQDYINRLLGSLTQPNLSGANPYAALQQLYNQANPTGRVGTGQVQYGGGVATGGSTAGGTTPGYTPTGGGGTQSYQNMGSMNPQQQSYLLGSLYGLTDAEVGALTPEEHQFLVSDLNSLDPLTFRELQGFAYGPTWDVLQSGLPSYGVMPPDNWGTPINTGPAAPLEPVPGTENQYGFQYPGWYGTPTFDPYSGFYNFGSEYSGGGYNDYGQPSWDPADQWYWMNDLGGGYNDLGGGYNPNTVGSQEEWNDWLEILGG